MNPVNIVLMYCCGVVSLAIAMVLLFGEKPEATPAREIALGEPVTVSCCGDSKIKCVDSTTGGNLCDLKICITPDGWNYECDRRPAR